MLQKKILFSLCLFCCFPFFVKGDYWTTSAKISYFSPKSSEIRKFYGDGFVDYQIEVTRSVFCNWQVWLDLDYYTASGHIRGDSSRLHVLPLSLGISYNWKIRTNLFWNVGLGGAYTYAHFQNYKSNHKNLDKWGGGGVFKTSLKYYLESSFFLELFLDYFYQHFNHHLYTVYDDYRQNSTCNGVTREKHRERKPTLNVGGTKIGLGIGYIF